ncbi:GDSL-type esterase/lipase family protein [Pontiellaceae bacterium B12227]|nr:GDSL-type esterase/lipase family protein [Pontiellaceae bacterium B12227]
MSWKNILRGIATALMLGTALGGIQPGSKDLGAIWFIGDSITQSNADGDKAGSPRKSLYDLLTAGGYTFSFTGHHVRNVDGLPNTGTNAVDNLYHYHSGISGSVIGGTVGSRVDMTQSMQTFWTRGRLAEVKPGIILMMLGTNDVGHNHELSEAPQRLKILLQTIYELPDIGTPTIFLASIPPNRRSAEESARVAAFNMAVPRIVDAFRAQGRDIHFVDQFLPLNDAYAANMRKDNLHPNATGNETMARQWFEAISVVTGVPEFPGKKTNFRGFSRYDLSSGKGKIIVLAPKKPRLGKPWVWKGWFWGNKLIPSTQLTVFADLKLLEEGYYVVMAGGDSLGHPSGSGRMDAAYELMTETYGFSRKPVLVGISRETLSVYRWASTHPGSVGGIYVDNGVCSVKSWPGGKLVPGSDAVGEGNAKQWKKLKERYGFSSDAEALAYRGNPIDLLEPLAKAGIPVLHICGLADTTVPYEENSAIVKERYQKLGGNYQEILKEGLGHHPHGLDDPSPIIDFVKQYAGR